MEKKFGRVWQPVGALKIPTFAMEKPLGATATQGRSRQGGPLPRRLPNIAKKVPFQKAEEEEEVARRDMSIDESDFLKKELYINVNKWQNMTQLLLLGKFEYTGGPIFKVVLEC